METVRQPAAQSRADGTDSTVAVRLGGAGITLALDFGSDQYYPDSAFDHFNSGIIL